jgi:HD domain
VHVVDTVSRRSTTDVRTVSLAAAFAAAGLVATAAALDGGVRLAAPVVVALCLTAFVAELAGSHVTSRVEVAASSVLIVVAAILGGPGAGALVGVAAAAVELRGPRAKWATFSGLYALEGVAAGLAAAATLGTFSKAAAATGALFAVNLVGTSIVIVARRVSPVPAQLRVFAIADIVGAAVCVPLAALFVYGHELAGLGSLLMVLVPVVALHLLLRVHREKLELATTLREGNVAFALSLARALDARDEHTAGHSAAVAVYARDIAVAEGLPAEDIAKIQLAGLLHDIGKIGVPAEVLNKPGPLTDDEIAVVRRHPEIGEGIAAEAPLFADIARFIRHHHERPDGAGYPDGLAGDRIPLASAIIGVADAYNAMTSARPYRASMAPTEAVEELRRGAGVQFDHRLVDVFVHVLNSRSVAYRTGQGEFFSFEGQRRAILDELDQRRALVPRPSVAVA